MVEHLRQVLHGAELVTRFRRRPTDFTRQRMLTFARILLLLLRGHKYALQTALHKVFQELGELTAERSAPSASAYCQARRKVQPEVFIHLNAVACSDYYQLGGTGPGVTRWHDRRVVGYDGTVLNLPDTPELRAAFGVQRNQHTTYVQAQAGVLYDVGNDLGLGAALGRVGYEKDLLLEQLWAHTQPGDVLVLDRNFPDYVLLAHALQSGREVVVRCSRQGFLEVQAFWANPAQERRVTLTVPHNHATQRQVRALGLPTQITVRLLKFTLPDGEQEVLLTTLRDTAQFPRAEFFILYSWRWREETYFKRVKHIFEAERFSGISLQAIRQDFFGVLFLATLEGIVVRRPQEQLRAKDAQRHTATPARVNRVISYVALLDRTVALLADSRVSPDVVVAELQRLLLANPTRHRPGRHYPRPVLKHSRRLRYHLYRKRIAA